jgi:hypothetical protein
MIMIKLVLIGLTALALTSCGYVDRVAANVSGYSKICVEGVTYLQFPSGVTPQVNLEGLPVSCQ